MSHWIVKPGEPGLYHVAKMADDEQTVEEWHNVTYSSQQTAQNKADELNG